MAALGNSEEHKYQVQDDEDNDNDRLPKDKEGTYPKDLVLVLSKSVAIRLLEENLQLLIYPDRRKRVLFKIWLIVDSRESPLTIGHVVEWEVPKFLATYFAERQQLSKVLTVTGELTNAEAQNFRDCLVQTLPEISPIY
jgi:hypothetical protein